MLLLLWVPGEHQGPGLELSILPPQHAYSHPVTSRVTLGKSLHWAEAHLPRELGGRVQGFPVDPWSIKPTAVTCPSVSVLPGWCPISVQTPSMCLGPCPEQCTVEPATVPERARLTSIGSTSAHAASGHAMPKALLPVLPHVPSCAAQVPPFQGNLPRHPYPSPSTPPHSPLVGLHVPTGTLSSTKLSVTAQGWECCG